MANNNKKGQKTTKEQKTTNVVIAPPTFLLLISNYRQVVNLLFLSKLIEKAALFVLKGHVSENCLPKNQSAYRRFHSCELLFPD